MKKEREVETRTPLHDMTLEDFLAALALIGLVNTRHTIESRVDKAYAIADEMIRKRKKNAGEPRG